MFTRKDLARVKSLIEKLVQKVTFNNISVADVNYLKADFTWLEELEGRIIADIQLQDTNIRKAAIAESNKQALEASLALAETPVDSGEIVEGFGEEVKPVKKAVKKKNKKTTKKKS